MENENSKRNDSVFSRKIRAGRRRTYFFDVRTTRANDYYLTITESKKRFDGEGYERHKLFIYKEDFNKFIDELGQVVDHIKGLMPDFDFDAFAHKYEDQPGREGGYDGQGNDGQGYDGHNETNHHSDNETVNEDQTEEEIEEKQDISAEEHRGFDQNDIKQKEEDEDDLKL